MLRCKSNRHGLLGGRSAGVERERLGFCRNRCPCWGRTCHVSTNRVRTTCAEWCEKRSCHYQKRQSPRPHPSDLFQHDRSHLKWPQLLAIHGPPLRVLEPRSARESGSAKSDFNEIAHYCRFLFSGLLANASHTDVEAEDATGDCEAFGRGHCVDGDALDELLGQGLGVGVGSGVPAGMPPLLPHAVLAKASIAATIAAITPRRASGQLSGREDTNLVLKAPRHWATREHFRLCYRRRVGGVRLQIRDAGEILLTRWRGREGR